MSIEAKARELLLGGDPQAAAEWRAQDPAHEEAFRSAELVWSAIGRTRYAQDGAWRGGARGGRPRWIAAAAAATAASVAVIAPLLAGPAPQRLRTEVAQTRAVALADGSRVFVGARSAVDVKLADDLRTVVLKDGEAFFEVARDDRRPFTVIAGDAVIKVTGTKFNVCRTPYGVQVQVLEGRVEVVRRGLFSRADQVVVAGEQVRLTKGQGLTPSFPVTAQPGAWRDGRLQYADVPLKEVVADANRYSERPIRLASDAIGEMRVTVSFRTRAVDELIANLDHALPISVGHVAGGIVLEEEEAD